MVYGQSCPTTHLTGEIHALRLIQDVRPQLFEGVHGTPSVTDGHPVLHGRMQVLESDAVEASGSQWQPVAE